MSLFSALVIVGFLAFKVWGQPVAFAACAVVGAYLLFSIKVADQWEKAAVLRLGKYRGLRGPGIFHIIPIGVCT